MQTVMFDLDDTLFDHRQTSAAALWAQAESRAALARRPRHLVEREFRRLLEETWTRVLAGELTPEAARAERFRRLVLWCREEISLAQAEALAVGYRAEYQGQRRPVPGALELLQTLHGRVSIGIVTNNFVEEQWEKLAHCGFTDLVSYLVTSEEVGAPKPGREIFDTALRRAGCSPVEAVMVGDNWASDIMGATRVGIRAVWFNPGQLTCPDHTLAMEIHSLAPATRTAELLLRAE